MRRVGLRLLCAIAALLQAACAQPRDEAANAPPPLHILADGPPGAAPPMLRLIESSARLRRAELPVAGVVRAVPPLEPGSAQHRVMERAEVRAAPEWSAPTVARLRTGQEVATMARVSGRDWYLVSDGGVGIGYLPGRALGALRDVPGAPLRAVPQAEPPRLRSVAFAMPCHTYARTWQRADGRRDEDRVEACRAPTGWQVTTLPALPQVAQAP